MGIQHAEIGKLPRGITAAAKKIDDGTWSVSGEIDMRDLPLGPFKRHLPVRLVATDGTRIHADRSLFTRVTGPVSVSPPFVYYGVVPRNQRSVFRIEIQAEAGTAIRSCTAASSDPRFLSVEISPTDDPNRYQAECTLNSAGRIGARNGKLTFVVDTGRKHHLIVPFYGFVKK